ncbi:MAG: GNAT family N-acetyltransferase [Desulfurivibrionaceae bacterium]
MEREIEFRREIYDRDVARMASWMNDDRVIEYLNENQNIGRKLKEMQNSQLPVFAQHFNRDGSFFLVEHPEEGPIGFLRLVPRKEKAEIVVVIGDPRYWGYGYGGQVISKGIRHAFYEWRKEKVIAKINKQNGRSREVFKKVGFYRDKELPCEFRYSLSIDSFLQH